MHRFNIFNQIHKGLRVLLYDAATTLQQTDFSDTTQTAPALEKVDKVIDMFHGHGTNEDEFILSLIKDIDPDLASSFEAEHEIDDNLSGNLKDLISYLATAENIDLRKEAGQKLCYAFNEFVAFNLYHLNKEELLINPLLWKHFTDAEIRAVNRKIVEKLTPEEYNFGSYWMMKGLNNLEIIEWLLAVKAAAPAPAFQELMQIAEAGLTPKRLKVVKEAITITPMNAI